MTVHKPDAATAKITLKVVASSPKFLEVGVLLIKQYILTESINIISICPIPTIVKRFAVNKSSKRFKTSMEIFTFVQHRRLISLGVNHTEAKRVFEILSKIELPKCMFITICYKNDKGESCKMNVYSKVRHTKDSVKNTEGQKTVKK